MIRSYIGLVIIAIAILFASGCDYRPFPPIEDHPNVPGTCDEMAPFGGEVCSGDHDNMGGALRVGFEPDEANWTSLDLEIWWRSPSMTSNKLIQFDQPAVLNPIVYDLGGGSSGATFWATMPNVPPDAYLEIYGVIHSEAGFSDVVFCDNDPGGVVEVWVGPYTQLDSYMSHNCALVIRVNDTL